jgi:glycosyltransferase involved in cell wall biosynthesis
MTLRQPMPRKKVVLAFINHYLPGYKSGGPVRSVANIVESLGGEFDFRVVAADRDMQDREPYSGIALHRWVQVGNAWVQYTSPSAQSLVHWRRLMLDTPHDVLYVNSFFNTRFSILPILAWHTLRGTRAPLLIAPRGELAPGAVHIKRWKKVPALSLARAAGLWREALWHASSPEEATWIQRYFGEEARCMVAMNLAARVDVPVVEKEISSPRRFRVVFFSRLSRKKNLDFALRAISLCRENVDFDIWGTREDEDYWRECDEIAVSVPANVRVHHRGALDHSQVLGTIAGYDLLFLPTKGENYGHVIAEALSVGTPVLISDRTPWRGLAGDEVGWDLPLEKGELPFAEVIDLAARAPSTAKTAGRERVRTYANKRLRDPSLAEANEQLFRWASASQSGGTERPTEP